VFAGDANAGVSCESCHGPASGYLKPHQTKGAYEESVARYGMTKLVGNIQGWTQQCTNCHVMNDDRLIKAGHPSGEDFDLGKRYLPVSLHFKKKYDAADVGAVGKSELAGIIRRRRPNAAPAASESPAQTSPAPPQASAPQQPPATGGQPPVTTPEPAAGPAAAPATPRRTAPRPDNRPAQAPPPGSPTSIEPAEPVTPAAASAPAPASAPAAPAVNIVLPDSTPASDLRWLVFGGLMLIVGVGAFLWGRSKK
jgi:hypothetical protein